MYGNIRTRIFMSSHKTHPHVKMYEHRILNFMDISTMDNCDLGNSEFNTILTEASPCPRSFIANMCILVS